MSEPVNELPQNVLRSVDTVQDAKARGLELEEDERKALWSLAKGGVVLDEFLGEEPL